jgi:hypothetical protein
MEYLVGAFFTLIALIVARYFYVKEDLENIKLDIKFSQSRQHAKTGSLLYGYLIKKRFVTQATNHYDNTRIRIAFTDNRAYWIRDNKVFEAAVIDGMVQEDSAKVVDMMALDDVKLKDMMFIIESLTEGINNDRGSAGDSKF